MKRLFLTAFLAATINPFAQASIPSMDLEAQIEQQRMLAWEEAIRTTTSQPHFLEQHGKASAGVFCLVACAGILAARRNPEAASRTLDRVLIDGIIAPLDALIYGPGRMMRAANKKMNTLLEYRRIKKAHANEKRIDRILNAQIRELNGSSKGRK